MTKSFLFGAAALAATLPMFAQDLPPEEPQSAPRPDSFKASVARWSNNAKGAVSLYYDDNCPSHLEFAIPTLLRHHIPGTFYVCPGNWQGTNSWLGLKWQEAAKNPEIVLGNHTWNHKGANNVDELRATVTQADRALRELLGLKPDALISFAVPGGVPWTVSQAEVEAVMKETKSVVRQGWGDAMANGRNCPQASAGGVFTSDEAIARTLDRAEANGSWQSILFHGVGGDWFAFDAAEHDRFVAECSKRMADGRLWIAPTISVQKYIAERDSASISAVSSSEDGGGEFLLTVNTPFEVYDVPLTIVATVPFEWQSVRISSHGLDFKVPAKAGRVVFEVPPRSGTVQISKDR